MFYKTFLYFNTLRYLKFRQIYWRIWYALAQPSIDPIFQVTLQHIPGKWREGIRPKASLLQPQTFFFLNQAGDLSKIGWDNSRLEKLWRYNQHYFDDLNALDAQDRNSWHQKLIVQWINENVSGRGTGWEPYPTSLRIVNWIKWTFSNEFPDTFKFVNEFNLSLANQARWLVKKIEWHLLGNHLFANAKALVFAGLYFEGDEANSWLKIGFGIIKSQLEEQVLNDGGHIERSTMYHAIFLEDLLDLINLAYTFSNEIDSITLKYWHIVAKKMLRWLILLNHPDGEIALFNDAAFGIAPCIGDLRAYADRLGIKYDDQMNFDKKEYEHINIEHLNDSGYIRLSSKNAVALLDVALVGPDYLPGHAHADTLSLELSLFKKRVIVNGGTSRYGLSHIRLRERQTLSHSTVEINGESSSEVWGGFRVARRAYPFDLEVFSDLNKAVVSCSHDGYRRLPGRPIHRRVWEMKEDSMKISDVVQGNHSKAIARFIFHPNVIVLGLAEHTLKLMLPDGNLVTCLIEEGIPFLEQASYSPEFGKTLLTQCLAIRLERGISSLQIGWG